MEVSLKRALRVKNAILSDSDGDVVLKCNTATVFEDYEHPNYVYTGKTKIYLFNHRESED